jgi:magnesium transporter
VGGLLTTKPSGRLDRPYDALVITRHLVDGTTWIDVVDPTPAELEELAAQHGLAQRTFDEAHRRAIRPTMHRFPDHVYVVAFSGALAEIDMWAGDGWFVTVRRHDEAGKEWEPTLAVERARRLESISSGMMLALVLEDLVDGYFDTTDALEDGLEVIEDRIFGGDVDVDDVNAAGATDPDAAPITTFPAFDEADVQQALFAVRRELLRLRRAVMPLREVLQAVLRGEVEQITGDALVICRDTFDKLLRAVDLVDELRELVGNAVEAHLAVMSNQMNLVMKQLTAWGSIVFGATLIAGIYGMNFAHMPELDWRLGYPFALGLMAVMSVVLYRLFKRNNWL